MNITHMYKRAFTYTGIEAAFYQISLLAHQVCLYNYIGASAYGTIGTLFSFIFLAINYLNFGLDKSIAPFFHHARTSKKAFSLLIFKQIIAHIAITTSCLASFFLLLQHYEPFHTLLHAFTPITLGISCAIILAESIKRTCKTVLHLALYHRLVSMVEVVGIAGYIVTVWLYLLTSQAPSLVIFFLPMLISSFSAIIVLGIATYHYYQTLEAKHEIALQWQAIAKARCSAYAYDMSHSWHTANFLVPLFAYTHGVQLAGLLKLVSMCAHSLNSILIHIFGITTDTLFSRLKEQSTSYKEHLFAHINSHLVKTLTLIMVILLGHYPFLTLYSGMPNETIYICSLFVLLILSENSIITYERFFILEQRTWFLVACNLFTASIFWGLYYMLALHTDATKTLYILIASRACSFLIIMYAAYILWDLRTSWRTSKVTVDL